MRKITQTIVGTTPPLDKNVLWLDTTNSNSPIEKVFLNGEWIPTSAAGGEYYTKDEVDENFMGKIDNPNVGNILVVDENGKAVGSLKKPADFLANAVNEGQDGQVLSLQPSGPTWVNTTQGMTVDDEMSPTSDAPVANHVIKEYVDSNFARQDGWYDTLVSGAAKNLVGHGTTPAEYTFRTSGGSADIGTGTATIDVLKGKTLKWNQLINIVANTSKTFNGITFTTNKDNQTVTVSGVSTSSSDFQYGLDNITGAFENVTPVVGHVNIYGVSGSDNITLYYGFYGSYGAKRIYDARTTNINFQIKANADFSTPAVIKLNATDLTLMFGAGNEPTTVAEFEALYPLDYYAYTATPILINNAAKGIVTTGFNQWDEEWELGKLDTTSGANSSSTTQIRSKNYIPVIGGNTYYVGITTAGVGGMWIMAYDSNKNVIPTPNMGGLSTINNATLAVNSTITPPNNCAYIRFYMLDTYGTTYNNDICINLSWSGYRNGEYEPYEKHTLYFNGESGSLATLKGQKLVNGEPDGNSVYIFDQTGMKSAGSVYDFGKADSDGYIRKVTKRIGSVDLGSLTWTFAKENPNALFSESGLSLIDNGNFIVSKYANKGNVINSSGVVDNMSSYTQVTTSWFFYKRIWVADNNIVSTDVNEQGHVTKLEGVMFYFELATPEEYLLDTPILANYIVNDFGTEQRIPVDTASNVMASISYDCRYALNAVDTIRRLPITYIKKESMDNFTTELASKLGTFLDATITITPSYDATNEEYDYSISITANENNG